MMISAMNIVADNKKQSFDRTIQAIVKDNSDPDKTGEIKISYKDAILPVYTNIKEVKNYPKGSHVYITIPNNDMSARKTILGLVEKIGPLTVMDNTDSYSLESRYAADGIAFKDTNFSEKEYAHGWVYKRNAQDNWAIFNKENDEEIINPAKELITFFKTLKTFAIQSDTLRLSANITALFTSEQRNLLSADYGIELDIYFQKISDEDYAFDTIEDAQESLSPIKAKLNIDQMNGDPYLQSNQSQYLIIDTSRLNSEYKLKKINFFYYRKDFPQPKEGNILPTRVEISNIVIEAVNQIQKEETADLAMYVTTPKGRMFLPKSMTDGAAADTLTLNAVIKEDGTQLDNTSLVCYWYERDLSYIDFTTSVENAPTDAAAIYDMAGPSWRLVTINDEGVPYSVNPLTVTRDELYGLMGKEYKVVGSYKGTLLSSTVEVKNLDTKNTFSLDLKTTTVNNVKTYTYSLVKSQDENNIEVDIRWYYAPDNGSAKLLRTIESVEEGKRYKGFSSTNRSTITIDENTFKHSGTILCEVYRYVNKVKRLYTTLTETYNANISANVLFYNFEQVFLYDINGNLSLINDTDDENKYSVPYKPVGISGNVSNIEWRIPQDYFERPANVYSVDKVNRLYIIRNSLSLSNLKIKTTYPTFKNAENSPIHENIIVDFTYNGERYRKTTNFAFVREGMNGTNGTGVYCRIVPNIDNDDLFSVPNPNTIALVVKPQKLNGTTDTYPKAMFNFLPQLMEAADADEMLRRGNNADIQLFRVQLWKKNQKVFDDYKIKETTNVLQSIQWSLFPATQTYLQLTNSCHITAGTVIPTLNDYAAFRTWLGRPQGINVNIKYQGLILKYSLPFVTVGITNNSPINFKRICLWRFFNEYDSFSLASYSKFYYNEDGLFDSKLSYQNSGNTAFTHYSRYPALYALNSENVTQPRELIDFSLVNQDNTLSNFTLDYQSEDKNTRQVIVYANNYFSNLESENVLLYQQNNFGFYYQIPLRQMLDLVNDSFITDWTGTTATIDEDNGTITTKYLVAGTKNADNTFTGALIGTKNGKTGLILYADGNRSMYLNAEGKIEIGQNPAEKIIENGNERLISNGTDEGLSIDLKNGLLNYKYSGNMSNDNELKKTIQIKQKDTVTFVLNENGVLQAKELVGKDSDRSWGVFENNQGKTIENNKEYFISNEGQAGLKELYIDSTYGREQAVNGLALRRSSLTYTLPNFAPNANSAYYYQNILMTAGCFALDSNGICVSANKGYSALTSSGYAIASKGFIPTNDSTKVKATDNVWRFNTTGLFSPSGAVSIKDNEAVLPPVVSNNVSTTTLNVFDRLNSKDGIFSGRLHATGIIHSDSHIQGSTVFSENQVHAATEYWITRGGEVYSGENRVIEVDGKTLHFEGGILVGVGDS